MTLEENALAYALALPPSESGKGGHDAAFRVACALVWGFDLDRSRALSVMEAWNRQRATPPWTEGEIAHKIDSTAATPSKYGKGYLLRRRPDKTPPRGDGVAPEPRGEESPRIPDYDEAKAAEFASGCPFPVSLDLLAARSPIPIPAPASQDAKTAELFFETVYRPGERVLLFTDFRSQGDFLWHVGEGGFRLSSQRGVNPVPSKLPNAAPKGVWFLIPPVSGEWEIHRAGEGSKYGRRHGGCVTDWRFLILESDCAPESEWLRILVQLPLRICAVYGSGGRSVHALTRIDARSKADHDAIRNAIRAPLAVLGADARALNGVRLSRAPGLRRGDRLQRLAWLDPDPPEKPPILDRLTR